VTPSPKPILGQKALDDIRQALTESGYTAAQIESDLPHSLLTLTAMGHNDELKPLISEDTPQHVLMRLFFAGTEVRQDDLEHECGLPVRAMIRAGILEPSTDGRVRAKITIQPHNDWWTFSDLPLWHNGYRGRDAVLPVVPPSQHLAYYTVRKQVDTALDIGTGCGVQALYLSAHAKSITATDLSERALAFAATTAALNGMEWELVHGDSVGPVLRRRFELVVSAMPVSVGPGLDRWMYRDSNRIGASLVEELADNAHHLLTEDGVMQFIAHWPQWASQPWQSFPEDYLAPRQMDTWITRHHSYDAEAYVDDWLSKKDPLNQIDREKWLAWLQEMGITSIGCGMVTIRWPHGPRGDKRIEELSVPSGEEVAQWIRGRDWMWDQHWDRHRYRLADDVAFVMNGQALSPQKVYVSSLMGAVRRWSVGAGADRDLVQLSYRGRTMPADRLAIEICGDATRPESQELRLLLEQWQRRRNLDIRTFASKSEDLVSRLLERGILIPEGGYRDMPVEAPSGK